MGRISIVMSSVIVLLAGATLPTSATAQEKHAGKSLSGHGIWYPVATSKITFVPIQVGALYTLCLADTW